LLNFKLLVIHYAYSAFSYVDTTLEKENIWITLWKDLQQFLLIREHFSTQLPHHHMPQINTGCWEHKNISFIVFLGCDESNNLFLHHHMRRVRIASWEEKIGIAVIVT
jgi:hypothetical protein